jgi:hypothetical protein
VIPKRGNQLLVDYKEWGFLNESADWVEKEGELMLSNYVPPNRIENIIKEKY